MALVEHRVGADMILVAYNQEDAGWITKLLRRIDPDLHCEKQLTDAGEHVWCVCEDTHRDEGDRYLTVYEWRDALGRPIPVATEGIVDEFRRRARERSEGLDLAALSRRAEKRNEEKRQRHQQEARDGLEESRREFERYMKRLPARVSRSGLNEAAKQLLGGGV